MRFVVLLLGFVGILLTTAFGFALFEWEGTLRDLEAQKIDAPHWFTTPTSLTGVSYGNSAIFMFIAAGYGLLGILLAFFRCGKQGGTLLLIPVLGAAFMNPLSLPFTALQGLTGLLSLFIGPLPIVPPAKPAQPDDDDEDD